MTTPFSKLRDTAMTDPAQPVEATPETDAKWHEVYENLPFTLAADDPIGGLGEIVPADFARSLERRLAQAQARCAELEKAVLGECEECGHTIISPLHHR